MRAHPSTVALLTVAIGLALVGGACQSGPPNEGAVTAAEETITARDMAIRVQMLATDEMQGRAPSTPGEALAIALIRVVRVSPVAAWVSFIVFVMLLGVGMFLRFRSGRWRQIRMIE